MKVTPRGLLLDPAQINIHGYAKVLRMPICEGSHWTFAVHDSQTSAVTLMWISLERDDVDRALSNDQRDVIVLLDTQVTSENDRQNDSHGITYAGACLLPTYSDYNASSVEETVSYVCPIRWGVLGVESDAIPQPNTTFAITLDSRSQSVLILSSESLGLPSAMLF